MPIFTPIEQQDFARTEAELFRLEDYETLFSFWNRKRKIFLARIGKEGI